MSDLLSCTAQRPSIIHRIRNIQIGYRWRAFCERLKWIGYKGDNIESYARRELEIAGWYKDDAFYGDMMPKSVIRMCRGFADEGHSGMSAGLAMAIFKDVAMFKPLTPLTGDDSEWNETAPGEFQNNRCSHVFKNAEGAYDINGIVFRDPSGATFTSRESWVPVTFPYTPSVEYRDVPA